MTAAIRRPSERSPRIAGAGAAVVKRIQRKRTRGWKMPSNTIYIGRPSRWGNPYRVGDPDPMLTGNIMTAADALRMFEWYLAADPELVTEAREQLRGHDLACWCAEGQPCHGDVWLRVIGE